MSSLHLYCCHYACRSFFELMLFFSKEEFVEKPLKDILSSFQVTTITDRLSSASATVIKMSSVSLVLNSLAMPD